MIVLNRPIDLAHFKKFYKFCATGALICADGGANRLFEADKDSEVTPDYIVGDFDSVREDVLQHYKSKGTKAHQMDCQDTTDLEKCLGKFQELHNNDDAHVIVYGAFGGRID